MNERRGPKQINDPEQRISDRLILPSLGTAALACAGIFAAKKLARPAMSHLTQRLDIAQHDSLPQNVLVFKSLAESCGVNVQEKDIAYWTSMYSVARALDTIVDETHPASIDNEMAVLLRGEPIPGITKPEAEDFRAIIANASEERRAIIMAGLKINSIAEKLRSTSNPHEMLRLRQEEGNIFARIMTLENPEGEPSVDTFNNRLISLAIAGYQFDTFIDLASDFKDGASAVAPTPSNYLTVGKQAIHDGHQALSQLPRRTVAGLALTGLRKVGRKTLHAPAHS